MALARARTVPRYPQRQTRTRVCCDTVEGRMRSRSYLLAAAALLFLPATARAQTIISGRVQGEDRAAVSDVAVTIPELGLGTVTRDDGRYSITVPGARVLGQTVDRKSTRLNSSHPSISYAVFCLKTK